MDKDSKPRKTKSDDAGKKSPGGEKPQKPISSIEVPEGEEFHESGASRGREQPPRRSASIFSQICRSSSSSSKESSPEKAVKSPKKFWRQDKPKEVRPRRKQWYNEPIVESQSLSTSSSEMSMASVPEEGGAMSLSMYLTKSDRRPFLPKNEARSSLAARKKELRTKSFKDTGITTVAVIEHVSDDEDTTLTALGRSLDAIHEISSAETIQGASGETQGSSGSGIPGMSCKAWPGILLVVDEIKVESTEIISDEISVISSEIIPEESDDSEVLKDVGAIALSPPKDKQKRLSPLKFGRIRMPSFGRLRSLLSPTKPKCLSPTKSKSLSPAKSKSLTPTKSKSLTPTKSKSLTPTKSKSLTPAKPKSLTPTKPESPKSGQDLSAFAMPLIGSDIAENMADPTDYNRPRSSSGSTALKSLLSSKSKSRNKSVEREDKKDKDKDKKKGFFEQFRPRSKSDVSGLKRPAKKSSLPTDRSMDESALIIQTINKSFGGSQEAITPMGQILEGQMLNVPEEERSRHKSGPSGYREGGFMSKFRTRSNSESKPKSPKRTLQSEKSLSPPASPRADRSGLSPLKFQSGEPRSAPPAPQRPSVFAEGAHTIIYRSGATTRLTGTDVENMEFEDLAENEDQVFAKFMRAHKCYDLIPTSAKLVIFDTQLNVKKAFFALIYNGVRAAPLWDTERQDYVGMLTITDFIYILRRVYRAPDVRMDQLEDHKIQNWREMVTETQRPFVYISPDASLFEAVRTLIQSHVHRLPIIDEVTGNAIYILTHKRILRFLHIYIKELPQPLFMAKTIKELGIGTYQNVITITPEMPLIAALNMFMDHRISALPVVNSSGEIINVYAKFDVINLAADKSYNNLDITIGEALQNRQSGRPSETVAICHKWETLGSVMEKIVKAEVHRLVVVDAKNCVEGIVSLSDLLQYIILRPMVEPAANVAAAAEEVPLEVQALQEPVVQLEPEAPQEQVSLEEPDLMVTENPPESS